MYLATAQTVGTAFTIGNWSIQWYGIIMALALLAGIALTMAMFKRSGKNPDDVLDLALVIVPLAIIGARAHYVIWSWSEFAGRPFWHVFAVWEGGMAIFGAVITGILGLWLYCRWKKLSFYDIADCLAPALALGQAIGRWGNFANQEVYGLPVTNPALHWFPMSVYIDVTGQYHYALFFYECIFNLILCALLVFVIMPKAKRPGLTFWCYMLGYGICRAIMEGYREEIYIQRTAGLPMNQIVAVLIAMAAAIVLIRWAYLAWRARQVLELSDDLVVLSSRGKVKVDADGNVIREKDNEDSDEDDEEESDEDFEIPESDVNEESLEEAEEYSEYEEEASEYEENAEPVEEDR